MAHPEREIAELEARCEELDSWISQALADLPQARLDDRDALQRVVSGMAPMSGNARNERAIQDQLSQWREERKHLRSRIGKLQSSTQFQTGHAPGSSLAAVACPCCGQAYVATTTVRPEAGKAWDSILKRHADHGICPKCYNEYGMMQRMERDWTPAEATAAHKAELERIAAAQAKEEERERAAQVAAIRQAAMREAEAVERLRLEVVREFQTKEAFINDTHNNALANAQRDFDKKKAAAESERLRLSTSADEIIRKASGVLSPWTNSSTGNTHEMPNAHATASRLWAATFGIAFSAVGCAAGNGNAMAAAVAGAIAYVIGFVLRATVIKSATLQTAGETAAQVRAQANSVYDEMTRVAASKYEETIRTIQEQRSKDLAELATKRAMHPTLGGNPMRP